MPSPSEREKMDQVNQALRENFTEEELNGIFIRRDNTPITFETLTLTPQTLRKALYVYGAGDDTPYSFQALRSAISDQLRNAPRIQRGTWQTMDVSGSDAHITRELINYTLFYSVPESIAELIDQVQPDMPWAEEHFLERVGRDPVNPPPSHVDWPHHGSNVRAHLESNGGEQFSHTYPERFWPKRVGMLAHHTGRVNAGVRFEYGDLDGVVNQLVTNPYTRQAVLPVWFPEDTGATDRRVPCSLTYHFMADEDMRLHVWYSLRACDFVRHFHNDVYFAARLLQWVIDECDTAGVEFKAGNLNMTISSLHAFEGDLEKMP